MGTQGHSTTSPQLSQVPNEMIIAQALADKYNMNILAATTHKARSARELAFIFDIPLASCYRKIRELMAAGLLEREGTELTPDGKRYSVYRSTIGSVTMVYEKGVLRLKVDMSYRAPIEIVENMGKPKERLL